MNEDSKGLWANIRAKRARGETPARKGSEAYKKAVAAAKRINASLNEMRLFNMRELRLKAMEILKGIGVSLSEENIKDMVDGLIAKIKKYNAGSVPSVAYEITISNRQAARLLEAISLQSDQLTEAEYQGRTIKLGKPMQGDVKKFKVYVKNPKGNVVKVNFGQKGMSIKKSDPARRRSFRARHNCDNPGPRDKARYWSCRKW
jgi:hypothetical protein